jgi:hypothetical protein
MHCTPPTMRVSVRLPFTHNPVQWIAAFKRPTKAQANRIDNAEVGGV